MKAWSLIVLFFFSLLISGSYTTDIIASVLSKAEIHKTCACGNACSCCNKDDVCGSDENDTNACSGNCDCSRINTSFFPAAMMNEAQFTFRARQESKNLVFLYQSVYPIALWHPPQMN